MEKVIVKTEKNAKVFDYIQKKVEDKNAIISYIREGKDLKELQENRDIKFVKPI
ncbi:hypothetical protein SAMN06295967_12113 [Belliella buryatensis]|uniref:Uncharacterized protein n=1 Tax=Belliella buryatensis TaxID=1500549 RepID=A0A239GZ28_9BACT|nr:hypothetical protein [Belliella buryatensis]SNS74390.1 hypothetical protein SAMN06295967_12113 [Belliella buryatensis]